jgi:hypothetical protein
MKHKKAMPTKNDKRWVKAVNAEHNCFVDSEAWVAVPIDEVPKRAKIIDVAWAMKQKANGTHRARLNAHSFQQVDGEHCQEDDRSASAVNDARPFMSF